ncbi:transposase [Fusobacterium polymorphum]|uniref:IS5/IS1182 family transposase n=1 Tax=Fusobacterium nucleatum subsp. polymorphum TaxID=76857 RepID=A0A2C6CKS3_FUSNP|nr:transposase [Fusobacterium polymorphum]PHI16991.1 IS5/IS1182 family transposase [Fusobacterium polymorphum]
MIKAINNNRYFKFFQPKLFYINQDINNDDPVRLLSAILEEMDFSNLLQVFPNKTKVHPVNMFAVIIYAYSRGIYSTRDIEYLCKDSQRAQYLLNSSNIPDYSAIARFLSKANNIIYELFCQFVEKLLKLSEITTETIYIDGTKIEAYANKYSFVWKKSTLKYKERLEENILQLIEEFNKYFNKELDSIFDILSFLEELKIHKIYGRGKRKSKEQLFLEKIKSQNIEVKNVVADAGYESLSNYEYLKINSYVSYIKPIYYEKSKTRKYKKDLNRVENLEYNEEENRLFRKDGLELKFLYYGKDKKTIYFRNPETEKKVRYNYKFRKLSKESKDNIESEFGKQLRMNRSIQVEGAFAVLKEDMKLRKLKVRGKESTKREIGLFCIAYNFNRYLAKLVRKKQGVILHPLKIA